MFSSPSLAHTCTHIYSDDLSPSVCLCVRRALHNVCLFFPSFFCLSACLEFVRVSINSELTIGTFKTESNVAAYSHVQRETVFFSIDFRRYE